MKAYSESGAKARSRKKVNEILDKVRKACFIAIRGNEHSDTKAPYELISCMLVEFMLEDAHEQGMDQAVESLLDGNMIHDRIEVK